MLCVRSTVLTPNVHQYNITEKIKQANSVLFSNDDASQRKHSPKVKFRDHKLVDFESDVESMEIQSNVVEDEISDDGYSEEIVQESIETEEVLEPQQPETEIIDEKEHVEEENYEKETFHDETEEKLVESCEKPEEPPEKPEKKSTVFRAKSSKISPLATERTKKSCCDYKNADEYKEKLPKYGGHNSTYVSKDVFTRQTGEFQHKQLQCKQEKFEQQLEQKKLLAETNEEAFSKW